MTSLLLPIIEKLQELGSVSYNDRQSELRIIADHFRAAAWLVVDGVEPSNKEQGYILRRLVRRALRFGLELGIDSGLSASLTPTVSRLYVDDYPEWSAVDKLTSVLSREEDLFRQTLRSGVRAFTKIDSTRSASTATVCSSFTTPSVFQSNCRLKRRLKPAAR